MSEYVGLCKCIKIQFSSLHHSFLVLYIIFSTQNFTTVKITKLVEAKLVAPIAAMQKSITTADVTNIKLGILLNF